MKAAAIALALAAALGCAARPLDPAPGAATGTVFHDRDGDGARGRWEHGIRGVAVSNGRDVVRTDFFGRYRLPVSDDTILFVVKPRGWMTAIDANMLPRFFYLHKPAGSPEGLRHPGVAPTGPLPAAVDFPLTRRREPDSFEMLLFGDTQPYSLAEIDELSRDIVAPLIGTTALFGMTLGDLVGDDLALFEPLNRAISRLGIPWYNVLGNHDMNFDAADDLRSDETFERVYGPATYAFQVGRVHFLVLDDVVHLEPRLDGTTSPYAGGLRDDQLAFVESYLAFVPENDLVVLAMHIPLGGKGRGQNVPERRKLLEILSGHPNTLSVSGHTHYQQHLFFGAEEGYAGPRPHHHLNHATVSGSWWLGAPDDVGLPHATMRCGAPNGWSSLAFDGNRYAVRFRAARRPAEHQMNIFAPDAVSAAEASESEVLVNFFAGSEHSLVEMRLSGSGLPESGDWTPLAREPREDPNYVELVARERNGGERGRKPLPPPIRSPHLWVGRLPANPPEGTLTLEVRATDMHGQVFLGHRLLRVE